MAPTKVAVLGGGVGSVVAAFELTRTPELRERFDVTVHQPGWRLGGKGASGRNADMAQRIEEHGLHLWFGFYDVAFTAMRAAYEELGRPDDAPLATLEEAFEPADEIVLFDRQDDGWRAFPFVWPRTLGRPGDGDALPEFWEIALTVVRWAHRAWSDALGARPGAGEVAGANAVLPSWVDALAARLARDVDDLAEEGALAALRLADDLASLHVPGQRGDASAPQAALFAHPPLLVELLTGFRDLVWDTVVEERVDRDPELRLLFTSFDVAVSATAGIVADGVLEHGFDAINDQELCDWLTKHGAKRVTVGATPEVRCPLLRSIYDVAFAYPGGDIGKADVAAGAAMNDLLRMVFTYRGAFFYKMQAGMGDAVFAPFYEVLHRRGVAFEFFSAATGLHLSDDHRSIEAVDVVRQVELRDAEYLPLVDVGGLPCWPSAPDWDQLEDGTTLAADGVNFELDLNPLGNDPVPLRRGTDFDVVVLGVSVAGLAGLCDELVEHVPGWREALSSAVTVQTQAFQLWLNEPTARLGWPHDPLGVVGAYVEPLDTYCDMSHLIGREEWPEGAVQSIAYFCGVLDERPGETQDEATERVHQNALAFLGEHVPPLWPDALRSGSRALRWDLLHDPARATGPRRLTAQYWRANTLGSERYVLTPAGTVDQRLRPHMTGVENLVVTGDWTRTGIDGGCVEAAAISGVRAASALIGDARRIPGEDTRWLAPSPGAASAPVPTTLKTAGTPAPVEPPFVEYGVRATSAGPFACEGGTLRGLVLEGDRAKLEALVDRVFTAPVAGALQFRPFGHHVLLMVGRFDRVRALAPPFSEWGSVTEVQAAFFVPVLAGHDHGGVFVAERLTLTVPYILVDNPMSLVGGREDYGFPKGMARFEPASGVGERMSVSVFGGDFGAHAQAGWRPFMDLAPVGSSRGREPRAMHGPGAVARRLVAGSLGRPNGANGGGGPSGEVTVPGIRLVGNVVRSMIEGRVSSTYLKQFRDAGDGTRACYQEVVEAPMRIRHVDVWPSLSDWQVTMHDVDSHPIGEELGVGTQRTRLTYELDLDFDLEAGRAI